MGKGINALFENLTESQQPLTLPEKRLVQKLMISEEFKQRKKLDEAIHQQKKSHVFAPALAADFDVTIKQLEKNIDIIMGILYKLKKP